MTTAICGIRSARHPRLVEEDAAEVIAIGEDLRLERQERASRVDQIDAGQAVLERDLLRADVLPDGHRIVRAALDGRVVGDDQDFAAGHAADAGDDAGRRAPRCRTDPTRRAERARGTVSRGSSSLSMRSRDRQLALLAVTLDVSIAAAAPDDGGPFAQLGDERRQARIVRPEQLRTGIDLGVDDIHVWRRGGRQLIRERAVTASAVTSRSSPSCSGRQDSARPRACGTSRRHSARTAPCRHPDASARSARALGLTQACWAPAWPGL